MKIDIDREEDGGVNQGTHTLIPIRRLLSDSLMAISSSQPFDL